MNTINDPGASAGISGKAVETPPQFRRPDDAREVPQPALRIAIADDHAVVRSRYRRLLELDKRMRIVAEFGDGESAYHWLASNAADVLILDLSMPGQGGLATLQRLRRRVPQLRVLIFTMHENADLAAQALRISASGHITKSSPPESLVAAVHHVIAGRGPTDHDDARVQIAGHSHRHHLAEGLLHHLARVHGATPRAIHP